MILFLLLAYSSHLKANVIPPPPPMECQWMYSADRNEEWQKGDFKKLQMELAKKVSSIPASITFRCYPKKEIKFDVKDSWQPLFWPFGE